MAYSIGVDTGGTFTDIVCVDGDGQVLCDKAFSTPADPSIGVLNAIDALARQMETDRGHVLRATERFAHGTTVSTNALIQRTGATVGLLTTSGFEDTLVIGRGPMGRIGGVSHDKAMDFVHADPPVPIVPRTRVRGLRERITRDGVVRLDLQTAEIEAQLRWLLDVGVDSLAVCLLWSFRNPIHEQAVRAVAARIAPDLPVSLSSDISPVLGEFERAMTTIVNAYIGPITADYINRLSSALRAEGLAAPMHIMKASGGSTLPERAAAEAVSIINSGPVGGVVAARQLGAVLGEDNLITTDMGGTSFDVGIIYRGEHEIDRGGYIDQGIPVQMPAARIVAIGAGGGSIAWTDGRRLQVGPRSAGSQPGPACYAAGGTEPTVTDALVVLGILDPAYFFGGRRVLQAELAERAIDTRIARPLGLSVADAAAGIFEIVNAKMADLVRKVTVESGFDPRRFSLVAYGGSGPAHCGFYASALGIKQVIIPHTSPVFSAAGVAEADVLFSYARSEPTPVQPSSAVLLAAWNTTFAALEQRARADLAAAGLADTPVELIQRVDLRYQGQMNEISLAWDGAPLSLESVAHIRDAFEQAYSARFGPGTIRPESPLEIITFRLDAHVTTQRACHRPEDSAQVSAPAPRASRPVYIRGRGAVPTPIYAFAALGPGHQVDGPCLIERSDTTIYVPENQAARMDGYRNLLLGRQQSTAGANS